MTISLKEPGIFMEWRDVMRGFQMAHNGTNPILQTPDGWLYLAEDAERRGQPNKAAVYLEAGLMREAYDRNAYEPPQDYQDKYGKRQGGYPAEE